MGSDQSENNNVIIKVKRKSIVHGYGPFPNVMCSLDFLDSQTWVIQIFQKKRQLFIKSLLNSLRELLILLLECSAEANSAHFLSHSRLSWTV